MSDQPHTPRVYEDDLADLYGDDTPECTWCGGEGIDECDDPIQCMDPACNGEMCTCRGCDGRGHSQVIW